MGVGGKPEDLQNQEHPMTFTYRMLKANFWACEELLMFFIFWHYSRRSIHSERVMHNTGSRRKDGDEKRDSQSPRREHSSRRRKGTYYPHKREQSEENHRSQIHGYNVKHRARSIDGDSYKEHDGYFIKKQPKREEINVCEDHEMATKLKREEAFHKQEKQKKKHSSKSYKKPDKEYRSSDWISDKIDDNEERRSNSSSADTYGEHNIDVKERYDGRYVSADIGSDKYSLEKASTSHDERTELDQHSSWNRKSHASCVNEWSSENGRVRKQDSGDLKFSSDGCRDGRKTTERNSSREEAHPGSRSCRKHDRSDREHDRSDRKSKHRRKNEEYYETREQSGDSDSDNMESNGSAYKKLSRSGAPIHSSASSRRKRSRGSSKES